MNRTKKKIKPTITIPTTKQKQENIKEEEEKEQINGYEESIIEGTLSTARTKRYKKKSVLIERSRSIFTFIGLSVLILIIPIFLVTLIWLITYLISTVENIYKIQDASYAGLKAEIEKIWDGPEIVGNTLAIRIAYEGNDFANSTSFNFLFNQIDQTLKASEKAYVAGLQLSYVNENILIGIKKVKEGENVVSQVYYSWNMTEGIDELPYDDYEKGTLVYQNVEEETRQINPEPSRKLAWSGFDKMANYHRIRDAERNENGVKSVFTQPSVVSCPAKGQQCSYVSQYLCATQDDPREWGFFAAHIQMPFIPDLLQRITTEGEYSFLINVNNNAILGSSIDSLKDYFVWNETTQSHVPYTIDTFPYERIKIAARELQKVYGNNFEKLMDTQNMVINNPTLYLMTASRISREGLQLIMVHLIPEWDYLQTPVFIGIAFVVFSCILLIITIIGGCLAALAIYKPLQLMVDNMDGITDGLNLEKVRFGKTPFFTEFNELHRTFEYLVEKLKLYRTFLPEHILSKVEDRKSDPGDIKLVRVKENGEDEREMDEVSNITKPLDVRSLSSPRSSVSSTTSSDGEGSLALKRVRASYVALYFHYDSKDVIANMTSFSKILSYINSVIRKKGGRIEAFTDTEVIIGFNTMSKIRFHEVCASTVAVTIQQGFQSIQHKGNANLIRLGIGVSCGVTYIGTIGSQRKRSWQSIGEPLDMAKLLAKHTSICRVSILFDDTIRSAVNEDFYHYRIADKIQVSIEHDRKCVVVYELLSIQNQENHQWVYDQHSDTFKWTQLYQHAIQYLFADEISNASEYISLFMDEHPDDSLGAQVKGLIYYLHEMGLTWKQFELSVLNFYDAQRGSASASPYQSFFNHRNFVTNDGPSSSSDLTTM